MTFRVEPQCMATCAEKGHRAHLRKLSHEESVAHCPVIVIYCVGAEGLQKKMVSLKLSCRNGRKNHPAGPAGRFQTLWAFSKRNKRKARTTRSERKVDRSPERN